MIFFDENLLDEALSIREIDNNLSEVKELRRVFKRIHRQMENSGDDCEEKYEVRLEDQKGKIKEKSRLSYLF